MSTEIIHWRDLHFITDDPDVYAPKPASLLLAEIAVDRIPHSSTVLDMCTGSGVVGLAVAKYVDGSQVTLSDVNEKALSVVQANASHNGVSVRTVASDFYHQFADGEFNVITVHPPAVPYLEGLDWGLSAGMELATNGGTDGSTLVTRSIVEARRCLKSGGELLLLLPHWSNILSAREHLRDNFDNITELARLQVEFFPARQGTPEPRLINHLKNLADEGLIEMTFEQAIPLSWVSVVAARA